MLGPASAIPSLMVVPPVGFPVDIPFPTRSALIISASTSQPNSASSAQLHSTHCLTFIATSHTMYLPHLLTCSYLPPSSETCRLHRARFVIGLLVAIHQDYKSTSQMTAKPGTMQAYYLRKVFYSIAYNNEWHVKNS